MFNTNNYDILVHNDCAVTIDTFRILTERKICSMCVSVSFLNSDNYGYIEYTSTHKRYTRSIESKTDRYDPNIVTHGMSSAVNNSCSVRTDTHNDTADYSGVYTDTHNDTHNDTYNIHAQNVYTVSQSAVSQNINTLHSVAASILLYKTHTPYIVHIHNSGNINNIILFILLGAV